MKILLPASLTMMGLILPATDLHASTPPPDTVFCLPVDFKQWERENPRPAGKRLADLNAGEPRTVRMIYFLPNDRPYREEVVALIKEKIAEVQAFYSEQMHAHGYGNRTFRFETNEQGDPLVHRVDGQNPDSHYLYNSFNGVMREVREEFDIEANNVYLLVIDNSSNLLDGFASGLGEHVGKNRGYALVPAGFSLKTVAHELGHAFGLNHDFNDDTFIMSYGDFADRLSMCSAAFLSVHPYFNSDPDDEETENATIELHSPLEYPTGSTRVSLQLEVSDPEGLHQVIFLVDTGDPHPAAGFPEVIACREMDGETNAVVEFKYNGVFPSNGSTSLSNPVLHPISFTAVDTKGNVQVEDFSLKSVSTPSATPVTTIETSGEFGESIAFSPDVTMLASGIWGSLRLWDMGTGMEIGSFSLSGSVESVRFSPDRTFLAFVSYRWIKFWNLDGRTEPVTFAETDALRLIAFSPDGTILASVTDSSNPTIKLWNVSTGNEIRTLGGHPDFVWTMAFSPDGNVLASRSQDGTLKLWNVPDGREIATIEGHADGARSLVFSPDGSTLASGYRDGTLNLWEVASGNRIATISASTVDTRISAYAFSPDGFTLAIGEGYGQIRLWDVVSGINLITFPGHTESVRSLTFSPDGSTLASAAWDNTVKLWDVAGFLGPRPRAVEKIAGDNLEGQPNSELDSPLVVQVRDQFGDGLEGVVVTFSVTGGDGKINGKYTVAKAVTDVDGIAKQTLTLGPDPGTNTVEVSVGLDLVTFHAMGVGSPAPPLNVDYRTGHLPDGATGRLGKGALTRNARALVFSPDGQYLAAAGDIGVWIYDVYTARELALFSGHSSVVTSLAFSPDGATLASGSFDGTAILWDVATGEDRVRITVDENLVFVNAVAISPDGSLLATAYHNFVKSDEFSVRFDYRVRLWEVSTGQNIATFEGHAHSVISVAFSPDGTTLASGSNDNTARLWDLATGQNIATLRHGDGVHALSFSPDGRTLATAGETDGILSLWDPATGEKIVSYRHLDEWMGWPQTVNSISFSPDGTAVAAGLLDKTIPLRDVETGVLTTTLEGGHSEAVESVAFSPDGATLASGSRFEINLWDVRTETAAPIQGHTSDALSISFFPDGSSLATGYADGTVQLWDVATKGQIATLESFENGVNSVASSPDGRTLASASLSEIRLRNVDTGDLITLEGHTEQVESLAFSTDGTRLASATFWGDVKLWDVLTGDLSLTLSAPEGVQMVAFSPDGSTLATGSRDGTISLWNVETGLNIATLSGHSDLVNSVVFSPDGSTLVSGAYDRTVRLWDVAAVAEISTLEGHTNPVWSVAFSPDGRTIASGSGDETVRLWDVATGSPMATLGGHGNKVFSVEFSPDRTTLASGSKDGTVLLWDLELVLPHPKVLTKLSGDDQQLAAGSRLAEPFAVSVLDQYGNPVAGATVTFTVTAGGGSLSATTVITDENGRAQSTLTLGVQPGRNTVTAKVAELKPIIFSASGQAIPKTIAKVSGDGQKAPAGAALSDPLVVEVKDQNDNPLEGVQVTFSVTEGEGALSTTTIATEATGRATTTLTLGRPGSNTVVATVAGIDPVTFTATAEATPDFDGDGETDFSDFFLFADAFGGSDPLFDLDGSGSVDFADFFLLADHFSDPARGKLLALAREMIGLPDGPQLQQNAPNPFNSQTVIPWFLLRPGQTRVEVFALTGQRVAVLQAGHKKTGVHRIHWDGRDDQGRPLASGVYLYRLVTTETVHTRKLTLLR